MALVNSNLEQQTEHILRACEHRINVLQTVASLSLPDCFVAAGFVRNAIWDALHQKDKPTPLNDVDVVYFNANCVDKRVDDNYSYTLEEHMPGVNWQVKNQARMHYLAPYENCTDAISHWVETATCVGVRLDSDGRMVFCAPYGFDDNYSLILRHNSKSVGRDVFTKRIETKKWLSIWPLLRVVGP